MAKRIEITEYNEVDVQELRKRYMKQRIIRDPLYIRYIDPKFDFRWISKKELDVKRALGWIVVAGTLADKVRKAGFIKAEDGYSAKSIGDTIELGDLILCCMPRKLRTELRRIPGEISTQRIKDSKTQFLEESKKAGVDVFDTTKETKDHNAPIVDKFDKEEED